MSQMTFRQAKALLKKHAGVTEETQVQSLTIGEQSVLVIGDSPGGEEETETA